MILLDTHSLLWYITDDDHLPQSRKDEIDDENILCFVSIASFWEIAIKQSLNKLSINSNLDVILNQIQSTSIIFLPIKTDHIKQVVNLPFHHRDPFDRLIIAQAKAENLTIITKDDAFSVYDVKIKWA